MLLRKHFSVIHFSTVRLVCSTTPGSHDVLLDSEEGIDYLGSPQYRIWKRQAPRRFSCGWFSVAST